MALRVDDDLYGRLGVASTATTGEITTAFRTRAREMHPDLRPGDVEATEAFKELTHAYDVLTDAARREAYDRHREARRPVGRAPAPSTPAGSPHLFRSPGAARLGLWSGVALVIAGLAAAVTLAAVVDTGDAPKAITLWLVAVKLLVCGAVLWGYGAWRLRRLRGAADATRQ